MFLQVSVACDTVQSHQPWQRSLFSNPMAILSAITLYPIKSCAGIDLRAALLTRAGLTTESTKGAISDREWMVVNLDGHFLTQREHPRMALIVPHLNAPGALAGGALTVDAPGMPMLAIELALPDPFATERMVQVWDDRVPAVDCGDLAADWFSQAIGAPCRLVRASSLRPASAAWTGGVAASTRFADGFPVLVIGSASLEDLNDKLIAAGRAVLPMDRFRPNLVFDDMGAFDEDVADFFDLGPMRLKPVKPCPRCTIPSVDQATSLIGPDPLDLLQTYRARPELDGAICFGMNSIVTLGESQRIEVGQQVDVTLAF
jgi:uncharacterized protein YcbX